MEAKRHCGGNSKAVRKEVSARLGRLVSEQTSTALSNWPWTDADSVLATFGLRVVLTRPKCQLDINCLKRPCAWLSGQESQLINYELNHGGIGFLRIATNSVEEATIEQTQ
ncbi:hypothetical protein DFH28DRAFT_922810 [Melampsora americana]|nr:hypothetical protein DFH28DRAFT_922810 [Melampsora americana]